MSMPTMRQAISLRTTELSKWYSQVTALQAVTLNIEAGIWGLLGPNGSGKTTLLRLAGGLLKPSVGRIQVCGEEPFGNPRALQHVGVCPEADALYEDLTGLEVVSLLGRLARLGKKDALQRATACLSELGMVDAMNRKTRTYSRGMRQRIKLAQAMLHEPKVLLLDEPLTGTDPTSRQMILGAIRRHADRGGLVLFSTHVLHEVEALTEQVLLLVRGQLVAQGNIQDIRLLLDEYPHQVHVRCKQPRELAKQLVNIESVSAMRFASNDTLVVDTHQPDATYAALNRKLLEHDYQLASLTSPDANLQTLFHYLVSRGDHLASTGSDAAQKTPTSQKGVTS